MMHAMMRQAVMMHAAMRQAVMRQAVMMLAVMMHAVMRQAVMMHAAMRQAVMMHAVMMHAVMMHAVTRQAVMMHAAMRQAVMRQAVMMLAVMMHAVTRQAAMMHTVMRQAGSHNMHANQYITNGSAYLCIRWRPSLSLLPKVDPSGTACTSRSPCRPCCVDSRMSTSRLALLRWRRCTDWRARCTCTDLRRRSPTENNTWRP